MIVVDAESAILGRLASKIAKELLKGEEIIVINSEKSIVSGNPEAIFERFLAKIHRGDPHKGPFYPKQPDRIFRRVVRGMLPYKKQRGSQAFKKLKVFMANPKNLQGEKISKTAAEMESKYLTLAQISKKMGWKQ